MAYTPVGWQTGDTITAERLNRMDRGWSVDSTQLFSETVTTADAGYGPEAELAYSQLIDADPITVTFDGTEYVCPRISDTFGCRYGAQWSDELEGYDFSEYPFGLSSVGSNPVLLATQTAGEHTVSASALVLQTSADFETARGYGYVTGSPTELFSETVTTADQGGVYTAQLTYSGTIDADTITVTFDGTEYTCPSVSTGNYGAPFGPPIGFDFSEFPFNLSTSSGDVILTTQTAGEHTIAVTTAVTSMQTSADFAEAVATNRNLPLFISIGTTTWQEAHDAMAAGRMAYTYHPSTKRLCLAVYATSNTTTSSYTITCMTIFNSSSFATNVLNAQSPTGPLTTS